MRLVAVGECEHPLCHVCMLRLRVLCEQKACPVCRRESNLVYVSRNLAATYAALSARPTAAIDQSAGIAYESLTQRAEAESLLDFNCPKCSFRKAESLRVLKNHLKSVHQVQFCDVCLRHLKRFPSEHETFTLKELTEHRRFREEGTDTARRTFGHPTCKFCNNCAFFDNDDLLKHLRTDHEECSACARRGQRYNFFANNVTLFEHYAQEHFVCSEPECRDKFCMYVDEYDLKQHIIDEHPNLMQGQRAARRQNLRVDAAFRFGAGDGSGGGDGTTAADSHPSSAGRREGRGGRDR
jgi:E3 ubiquitin-protein ligase ZNF598